MILPFLPFLLAVAPPSPDAGRCERAAGPALLVHVVGFANRRGTVRVRLFGPPVSSYFDKARALRRIELPVPATGPVAICVPVPAPGLYAVDVRHDVNGNGKTDRSDGGGASGDPHLTLFDMLFSRKPDPRTVQVAVGRQVVDVSVTLMYLKGGSFRPAGL